MKDYYKILEVSPDASDADIKKSFRKLAKKYHPDTNGGDPKAAARFQEINEAYTVLGDEAKKKEYDDERLGKKERKAAGAAGTAKGPRTPRSTFTGFTAENFKMDFGDEIFEELNKSKAEKKQKDPNNIDVSSQFASFFGFKPR